MCRYILSIRLEGTGEAQESAVLQWVEEHVPGAELQQKSPGSLSFSVAQEVRLACSSCNVACKLQCRASVDEKQHQSASDSSWNRRMSKYRRLGVVASG